MSALRQSIEQSMVRQQPQGQQQQQPQSPLHALLDGLTHAEQIEFAQAVQYIDQRMSNNQGQSPEGTIAAILNKLSPAVQEKFQLLSQVLETPRVAPFAPKMTQADHLEAFGLDPVHGGLAKDALDGLEVAGRLQQRMGTDANRKQGPLTRREQISAAFDASNTPSTRAGA